MARTKARRLDPDLRTLDAGQYPKAEVGLE
jgi:hypothetical protein